MASILNRNTVPRRRAPREVSHAKLIVTRRSDDYLVQLDGRSDVYSCGLSVDEALGDWLRTHGSRLNVEIVCP